MWLRNKLRSKRAAKLCKKVPVLCSTPRTREAILQDAEECRETLPRRLQGLHAQTQSAACSGHHPAGTLSPTQPHARTHRKGQLLLDACRRCPAASRSYNGRDGIERRADEERRLLGPRARVAAHAPQRARTRSASPRHCW